MAVKPTKKRVSLSVVVGACNTNPKKIQMPPRLLNFFSKPAQHQMIMASKRFNLAITNKKK